MILDQLASLDRDRLGDGVRRAVAYLESTDLGKLENGRHAIDGDQLYVMINRYRTRALDQIVWESHRRYLDVQYMVEGAERMGYVGLHRQPTVTQAYDAEKDCALYSAQGDLFEVRAGEVAIFYPHDVHAPGLAAGSPANVIKAVVKVAVGR